MHHILYAKLETERLFFSNWESLAEKVQPTSQIINMHPYIFFPPQR